MKDRFSSHASLYASFRPTYPKALYDFIFSLLKANENAWDVGCGNGQVTRDLAPRFTSVCATDISKKQLENAPAFPNVTYTLCPAHESHFADNSFDLITVGQALHWFRIPEFFTEAKRVGKPDAVIAVWGYSLLKIDTGIDELMTDFYTNKIGPYWDPERKLVDEQYQTIQFPFAEIKAPSLAFSFEWTLEEFAGYLTTWSSVQKYIKQHDSNPVDDLIDQIRPTWGSLRKVSFPLFTRIGRIKK